MAAGFARALWWFWSLAEWVFRTLVVPRGIYIDEAEVYSSRIITAGNNIDSAEGTMDTTSLGAK